MNLLELLEEREVNPAPERMPEPKGQSVPPSDFRRAYEKKIKEIYSGAEHLSGAARFASETYAKDLEVLESLAVLVKQAVDLRRADLISGPEGERWQQLFDLNQLLPT